MPYIIDGHNLIGQMPELSLADIEDEQQLIEILKDFCLREQRSAEVYFDNASPGVPRARNYGRLSAFFSRAGKSADQAIAERLHRLGKEARNWTVVSSDRQVQAMAKAKRAKVLSAAEFARQLKKTTLQPEIHIRDKMDMPNVRSEDINYWLKVFRNHQTKNSS